MLSTRFSGCDTGRLRSTCSSIALKMAVFPAIPSAMVRIATIEKAGLRHSVLAPYLKSRIAEFTCHLLRARFINDVRREYPAIAREAPDRRLVNCSFGTRSGCLAKPGCGRGCAFPRLRVHIRTTERNGAAVSASAKQKRQPLPQVVPITRPSLVSRAAPTL